jgi:hypothetical protein
MSCTEGRARTSTSCSEGRAWTSAGFNEEKCRLSKKKRNPEVVDALGHIHP